MRRVFLPLAFIVGFFGQNFDNLPCLGQWVHCDSADVDDDHPLLFHADRAGHLVPAQALALSPFAIAGSRPSSRERSGHAAGRSLPCAN
jgi:hypothetical protein